MTLASKVTEENEFRRLLDSYHNEYCERAIALNEEFGYEYPEDQVTRAAFESRDNAILYEYTCLVRMLFEDDTIRASRKVWKFVNKHVIGEYYEAFRRGQIVSIQYVD